MRSGGREGGRKKEGGRKEGGGRRRRKEGGRRKKKMKEVKLEDNWYLQLLTFLNQSKLQSVGSSAVVHNVAPGE